MKQVQAKQKCIHIILRVMWTTSTKKITGTVVELYKQSLNQWLTNVLLEFVAASNGWTNHFLDLIWMGSESNILERQLYISIIHLSNTQISQHRQKVQFQNIEYIHKKNCETSSSKTKVHTHSFNSNVNNVWQTFYMYSGIRKAFKPVTAK